MPPIEYYPSLWPRVTDQYVWGAGDGPDPSGWEKQAGSCVANAICTMKEIHEYRQFGTNNMYSVGWVFGNRSSSDYESDYGMYVYQALNHLVSDGVPFYTDLIENQYNGPIPWKYPDTYMYYNWTDGSVPIIGAKTLVQNNYSAVINSARRAKIASYTTILVVEANIDTIKQSIIDNGSVLVQTYIANSFDNLGGSGCTGIVPPVDYNITVDGEKSSHVMNIIGWKLISGSTYWIVHNNWGNWWWGDENRRGICYMPINYSNILEYSLVIDDISLQQAPAPTNCVYAPDSQYPLQYINASATVNTNIGTLYFDKKLNFGPYADNWYGFDIYNGGEMYQDISTMTSGQTVQFRAKYTNVAQGYLEAEGADLWGWAYSPVYTKIRPNNFAWTHVPVSGYAVALTAVEWNAFTTRINEFRAYKSLSQATFTHVESGMNISAVIFNQAMDAISGMKIMSGPWVTTGTDLYAQYFNVIVNDLNSIL